MHPLITKRALAAQKQPNPPAQEKILLLLGGIFIGANQIGLVLALDRPLYHLWPFALWIACAGLGWFGLRRFLPHHDPYLYPTMMLLTGWGLNLIHRLLPRFAERQALWLLFSLAILLTICALPGDLRWLRRYRYTWLLLGLALLTTTILIGVNPSGFGPRLWLGLRNIIFFQPSELLKVILVAFLASYMADHQQIYRGRRFRIWGDWPSWRFLGPIFLMWGVCLVLLIWQRDLGMATIFFVVFMLMLYVASGQLALLLGGSLLLAAGSVGAYHSVSLVARRVDIWLNPWANPDGASFQIVQSLFAIADGGAFGSGIGQGIPNFIPVVHTDFAYAAIIEEWGLLGGVMLIACLLILILRGLRVALLLQHKPFHAYLAVGLSISLAVQSLIIIGGTLSIVPLTGVTLPFVSYGGSSLLTSFITLGLLLKLSSEASPTADTVE